MARRLPRKRCTECRGWYRPSAQAAHNQKTCSRECRKKRRARTTRRRRGKHLQDSRVAERERQRESRRRRRQGGSAPEQEPPRGPKRASTAPVLEMREVEMLRVGLALDVVEIIGGILDCRGPLSLAGIELQVVGIIGKYGQDLGQVGQNPPRVTRRRHFVTYEKCEGILRLVETRCHSPAVTSPAPGGR